MILSMSSLCLMMANPNPLEAPVWGFTTRFTLSGVIPVSFMMVSFIVSTVVSYDSPAR